MTRLTQWLRRIALALCVAAPMGLAANTANSQEWQFRVYLDDREIGYHNFRLKESAAGREVETEARFKVKFLFFNAYRYEHVNTERWQGDCLQQIQARTLDNGDEYTVQGSRRAGEFVVASEQEKRNLPPCVMTFAYWNPDFLKQERLLNAQTGEYLEVRVEPKGDQQITVRGEQVEARRYQLSAKDMQLELWYSEDQEWLGLKSTTQGGRTLRYELL